MIVPLVEGLVSMLPLPKARNRQVDRSVLNMHSLYILPHIRVNLLGASKTKVVYN